MIKFDWRNVTGSGAVQSYLQKLRAQPASTAEGGPLGHGDGAARLIPDPVEIPGEDKESLDVWGFADSGFALTESGNVTMRGSRYPLCGEELPNLIPWIRDVMEVPIPLDDICTPAYPPEIPAARRNEAFFTAIEGTLAPDQVTDAADQRLRHGHGHTQEEMYNIKYGKIDRVPDLVVWPTEEEQVETLVKAAGEHGVCLIPYGGGTSVTHALQCPTNEDRMIVSVDMRRMNRIEWIDPVNRMARIQAGAVGRHIIEQLSAHGFTMGHEPDSIEFSTLGGWIATHASGMKKNKYGNIEDLLLDVNIVTNAGTIERSGAAPRESIGLNPRIWMLGSEGMFGIITSAIVKLFPLPEEKVYGSILFPTFEDGLSFMYELTQEGAQPASVRLVDNIQFQFGMALKPKSEGWAARKSAIEKFFVTKIKGFAPDKMVACTLVIEGSRAEVAAKEAAIYRLGSRHRGMKAGVANGERGYQLTFGIAYIRDFVMNFHILAESFETSVPWSQALTLCDDVKAAVYAEHDSLGLPGKPFVTCRVTQVYDSGVCIYFYLAYCFKGVEHPTEMFDKLEIKARETMLSCGGSLSHHHGVGKIRKQFLPDIMSPAALAWNRQAKQALDPENIFGCANQMVTNDEELPSA